MREVGAFEAKNTLGSLLDQVQRGEEIVITRHGVRVARLVPDNAQAAAAEAPSIPAARNGVPLLRSAKRKVTPALVNRLRDELL